MNWLVDLITQTSAAQTILILSVVIAMGVILGNAQLFGVGLGITGVLFAGLVAGHFQLPLNEEVIAFVKEFGLILFVFSIGLQVGPGFFSSLRKHGIRLNLLAALIVGFGVLISVVIFYWTHLPVEVVVGILAGAVTNTPSLGAAQQMLKSYSSASVATTGLGYAVAYPFGVFGIILTMVLVRSLFKIKVKKEAEDFERGKNQNASLPTNFNIVVSNPRLVGKTISALASLVSGDFAVSRVLRANKVEVAKPDTVLQIEDVLHVVCSKEDAKKLAIVVGEMSDVDVRKIKSLLTARPLLLTQKQVVGKSIEELNLSERYGISITRIHRAGLDLVAHPHIELQFGDRLTVVGEESAIQKVALELGDSLKQLHHPNLPALFLGIVLGVFLGSIPFKLPGVALPVKLGLAGGPLIVAIILARVGKIGPIIFYLPENTNLFLRELGITLFLAGVGLGAGGQFVETLLHGAGLYWIFLGAVITFVPLFIGALVARLIFKMNFMTLCGLLAGSMTDPPALSYANQLADSDAPSVTYASVYPLVMFLRIVTAQLLVIFLARV